MAEFYFRSIEAPQNKPFIFWLGFSYALHRNFPCILFRSKFIQEFHACAMVKLFSIFGGKYEVKIFFANLDTRKVLPGENLRRLRHYGPGGYSFSGCKVPEE
jgi:hypothetical protein